MITVSHISLIIIVECNIISQLENSRPLYAKSINAENLFVTSEFNNKNVR